MVHGCIAFICVEAASQSSASSQDYVAATWMCPQNGMQELCAPLVDALVSLPLDKAVHP